MGRLCEGRICAITGAGNGLGRAYALMLAAQGASVVVNDIGVNRDGTGEVSTGPAQLVVDEIAAAGGTAVADTNDISTTDGANAFVRRAIDEFGRLDVLINNAGILRDRTLVNMTDSEWDDVIRVHLRGTYAPSHAAARYWKEQHAAGAGIDARLINTTSVSGIFGNYGQANYGAAKAGIAAFTVITSMELARYGVTVNAISPGALTRLTEDLMPGDLTEEDKAQRSPDWVASIVTWLASEESKDITGRVILSSGSTLAVAEGWVAGPSSEPIADPEAVGPVLAGLVAAARTNSDMSGAPKPA
ncbi:SDR family NAD(P)-dependent oxidoreductase [Desertimonas flava]|jgi:NAD(P)-dependent dehydrogenase (short-subunit alcohol dehydrogenase family)|uniref:SDR family NAD(P)-dependent oxidoreductase n=1 Tax=Desertimonas flava TaxID=2064846 RepID=UPI000E344784|nr:SDR family NAD(P)-dependent oxidoreductase [Desertimonas flava]